MMRLPKLLAVAVFAALLLSLGAFASGAPAGTDPPAGDAPALSLGDAAGVSGGGRQSRAVEGSSWVAWKDIVATGNTVIEPGVTMHMAGYKLTVYGDLTVSGDLYVEKGSVAVYGNLVIEDGLLIMTDAADLVQVSGSVVANGRSQLSKLTAGKVKVGGDFLQRKDYSTQSWYSSGTHVDEFSGPGKLIQFASPAGSALRNPVFVSGTTFTSADREVSVMLTYRDAGGTVRAVRKVYHTTGGTKLSISRTLTADYAVNAPTLYYTGKQNGWKLTAGGTLVVPAGVTYGFTGSVSAKNIVVEGGLTVAAAGKTIAAAEKFTVTGGLSLTAGAVTARRFEAAGPFAAEGAGGSVITLSRFTSSEVSLSAAVAHVSGSLAGRRVTVAGSLEVPAGQSLDVGGGRLDVSGDMTVSGLLVMDAWRDTVFARGDFAALGGGTAGSLTGGFLVLMGDFAQSGSADSFCASGDHRVLLCGGGPQKISFADAGVSSFANLYSLNALVTQDMLDAQPCSGPREVTSVLLDGIAVSGGGSLPLCPPFGAANPEVAVPRGVDSVAVLPDFRYDNQTAVLAAGGSALPGSDVAVAQGGPTAVSIEVLSAAGQPYKGAGAPFSATYALTLQPQNPELASPGFAYQTDRPFGGGVTEYAVTVPAKDASFTFAPSAANSRASFRFRCFGQETAGPAFTHLIAPGAEIPVDVVVTSYGNGETPAVTETYRFTFRRQTLLDGVGLFSGSLNEAFSQSLDRYTVDVPASVWSVELTPLKGGGCASLSINGNVVDSVELKPAAGCAATATIVAADASGSFRRTVMVTVRRAPLLSGIEIVNIVGGQVAAVCPAFSQGEDEYTAVIPINAGMITVRAIEEPGCLGVTPDNLDFELLPGGTRDVTIVASAGDRAEQKATYRLRLTVPLMAGLVPSSGSLDAPFDPIAANRVMVPYASGSVTLTPVGNDGGAGLVSFTYLNQDRTPISGASPNAFALAQGQTRTVIIKAAYGSYSSEHTVTLYREKSGNADLAGLGASAGWLSPSFRAAATSYTLVLPETVSGVTLTPVRADANASVAIDGKAAATKTVSVPLYNTVTVRIAVTAYNGTVMIYTVAVRRKPMLLSFAATPLQAGVPSLSPGGTDLLAFSYTVSLPVSVKLEVKKGGSWVAVMSRSETSSGAKTYAWNGRAAGAALAAGTYIVRLTPYWAGKAGTARTLTVRILPKPAVTIPSLSPSVFTANGTNKLTATVKWTVLSDVRIDVVNSAGAVVKTLFIAANQAPATKTVSWDGKNAAGALVPAGPYRIRVVCGGAAAVYKPFTVKR